MAGIKEVFHTPSCCRRQTLTPVTGLLKAWDPSASIAESFHKLLQAIRGHRLKYERIRLQQHRLLGTGLECVS